MKGLDLVKIASYYGSYTIGTFLVGGISVTGIKIPVTDRPERIFLFSSGVWFHFMSRFHKTHTVTYLGSTVSGSELARINPIYHDDRGNFSKGFYVYPNITTQVAHNRARNRAR